MSDIPARTHCIRTIPSAVARRRFDDPVVLPGATIGSMTDHICAIALRERAFCWWWIAMIPSSLL